MKPVNDFYNKAAVAIKAKYFATDSQVPVKVSYALELMNNGCLTYGGLINKLAVYIKDTKLNLHDVIKPFIADFTGYEYTPEYVNKYVGLEVVSVFAGTEDYSEINRVVVELESGEKLTLEYNGYFEVGYIEYRLTCYDSCGYWFFELQSNNG